MKPILLTVLLLAPLGAAGIEPRVAVPPVGVTAKQLEQPPEPHFNPANYGAKMDGVTYDTEAIQKAINACAGTSGSVVFSPGKFLTKPLELRGRMTFYLEKGAVLLGSPKIEDYPVLLPPQPTSKDLCRSLLYACNADGLTIEGEGEINGQCQQMNMPAELKKWGTEAKRPSLLRIFRSKDVTVRNLTLRNPCMWTQIYSECDHLLIDSVTVDAPPDCPNLDGVDVCDSRDVVIRNCNVRSEDDSICLKSLRPRGLQNILVENNRIRCYRANAIKLGTATVGPVSHILIRSNRVDYAWLGGINIESVDGSAVRDVVVQDLDLHRVGQPIFVRLGQRKGRNVGSMEGVTIERLRAYDTHKETIGVSSITGIPGARVRNVRVKDCYIEMPGGIQTIPKLPAEKESNYPQSNMFSDTPGYAFFVRHADGVVLENVTVRRMAADVRPWLAQIEAEVKTPGCRDLGQIQPDSSSK